MFAPRHIIHLDKATRLVLDLAALLVRKPGLLVVFLDIVTSHLKTAVLDQDFAAETVYYGWQFTVRRPCLSK